MQVIICNKSLSLKAVIGILAFCGLILAATGGAFAGGTLNRGISADPTSLDPHSAWGASAVTIVNDLFVGLMTVDAQGELVPGLAEGFTVDDAGTSYTFTLRENLKWSDGVPLTAEDFVYSFRRALSPQTATRQASLFYSIKNARKVVKGDVSPEELGILAQDEHTLVFTLEQPVVYFPKLLFVPPALPVPRHIIEQHGRAWTRPGNMVSNGPFLLAEYTLQSHIKAVKNPLFYDAAQVQLDEINYYPTQDLSTTFKRYRAGELDVILNFPPNQIDWIRENLPGHLRMTPTLGLYYYVLNTQKPPLDDLRVRKALALALDNEIITDLVLRNGVIPASGVVPEIVSGYQSPASPFGGMTMEDRLTEARALLADAGYSADNPLRLKLKFDTQQENQMIALAASAMWREVGVEIELENIEFRVLTSLAVAGDFEILRYTWYGTIDDPSGFLSLYETGNASNRSGYSNPELDLLLRQSDSVTDAEERAALLQTVEQMGLAGYSALPIFHYVSRNLVNPAVKGWVENPLNANYGRHLKVEPPQ